MSIIHAYISSVRPATLLIAMACTLGAGALALFDGAFNGYVFVLLALTTCFLQILSNLANDYGDYHQGTDQTGIRIGPKRAIQKGEINISTLKGMLALTLFMTVLLGVLLIYTALSSVGFVYLICFVVLGAFAIWAAIKYTAGENPYGYKGLGDIFTFLFFGPVGIVGGYFLLTHHIKFLPWLPSLGFGILTVLVININNMRDADNDLAAGKVTIPIMLGAKNAKHYHAVLTLAAFLCYAIFNVCYLTHWYQYLYLLVFIGLFKYVADIYKINTKLEFAPYLKKTVFLTFAISVAFSIFINLHLIMG